LNQAEIQMDGYQFIAIFQSVVSLAWPAAVFGSVWLFRDKLRTLLPLLRMKYKDLDLSFRLDEAEREAAKIPPTPPSPDLEPTPEEKTRFERLARISPRAADLPLNFHPVAIRASAVDTPIGAV
jgi:hypothetical protein